jgi:hypothetical protein
MTPEAKQRVRETVRRIQSSALQSAPAAATRTAPASAHAHGTPKEAAGSPLATEGNSAIKDGYDHS